MSYYLRVIGLVISNRDFKKLARLLPHYCTPLSPITINSNDNNNNNNNDDEDEDDDDDDDDDDNNNDSSSSSTRKRNQWRNSLRNSKYLPHYPSPSGSFTSYVWRSFQISLRKQRL